MWWVWVLMLAAAFVLVVLMVRSRGAIGNARKEDISSYKRSDRPGSNPDLPGGFGGMGGV